MYADGGFSDSHESGIQDAKLYAWKSANQAGPLLQGV